MPFLIQQNAFDDIDRYCSVEKQVKMLAIILRYYDLGSEAISKGVPLVKVRRLQVVQDITKMRFTVSNDNADDIDRLELRLERSMMQLGSLYDE